MPANGILQTVRKIATAVHRLDEMALAIRELRLSVASRLEKLEDQMADARERLARLEASRAPTGLKCKRTWQGSRRKWSARNST
jgi:hypothetical protein